MQQRIMIVVRTIRGPKTAGKVRVHSAAQSALTLRASEVSHLIPIRLMRHFPPNLRDP